MSVYELAQKSELAGEDYYNTMAEKSSHERMKAFFTLMAKDERKHYEIVKDLSEADVDFEDSPVMEEIQAIFTSIKNDKADFKLTDHAVGAYQYIADIEQASIYFYENHKENAVNEHQKEIFQKLLEEEKVHLQIIENLIGLVKQPDEWIESDAFKKIIEY